jgi:hypothetical protein
LTITQAELDAAFDILGTAMARSVNDAA